MPQRYLIGVAGISISGYTDQGVAIDRVVPTTTGPGYDMTIGLQPIADLGLQEHVSVVSGLEIPWEENGVIPAGGRRYLFHAWSLAPLISGVRSQLDTEAAQGETSDRIVARAIAGDTAHRCPHFRVQAAYYRGDNGNGGARGRISYRDDNGTIIPDDPIVDPYLAFQSLFSTFVPPDPRRGRGGRVPAASAQERRRHGRRRHRGAAAQARRRRQDPNGAAPRRAARARDAARADRAADRGCLHVARAAQAGLADRRCGRERRHAGLRRGRRLFGRGDPRRDPHRSRGDGVRLRPLARRRDHVHDGAVLLERAAALSGAQRLS
ncbi:MAG: DUF1552 domain-containing protein [Deltaproteobacteria bacterium]|nr:DUF1552 domain-containing protein [Deltaproteobacteria bacterium]